MSVVEEEEPGCGFTGVSGGYERRAPGHGTVNNDWSFAGSVAAAARATLRGSRDSSSGSCNTSQTNELLASQRNSYEGPTISPQDKQTDACEHYFKVMLLGDSGVGKTCLLTRFRDGRFLYGNYMTTVGIDFRNKIVTVDDSRVKLQIWDTAGQERFRSVTHAYYRDAHALLLLYDVTNKTSYDNIRAWLGEIREYAHDDVVIMLLGNKCDCGNERTVKKEDGERLAREYSVPFMETSAKTGLNVELAFFAVARGRYRLYRSIALCPNILVQMASLVDSRAKNFHYVKSVRHLKARKSGDPDTTKFNVQDYVRQQSRKSSCFNYNCSTT